MSTAISLAFAKAGLVSKKEAEKVKGAPFINDELLPLYEEIERISNLLTQNKIPVSLLDFGTLFAMKAMQERGEKKESLEYFLNHMKKVARENNTAF